MYSLLPVLLVAVASGARAFDAVVWSAGEHSASADKFVYEDAVADTSSTLVIFLVDDFDLVKFNRFANVYSGGDQTKSAIKDSMKSSKGYDATWLGNVPQTLPADAVDYAQSGAVDGHTVVLALRDLAQADQLVADVLAGLRNYVAVLANSNAFQSAHKRDKRQVADGPVAQGDQSPAENDGAAQQEQEDDAATAAATSGDFPIKEYATADSPCSLYIDSVSLMVRNDRCTKDDPSCPPIANKRAVYSQPFNKDTSDKYKYTSKYSLESKCTKDTGTAQLVVTATATENADDAKEGPAFTKLKFSVDFALSQDWYWKVTKLSVDSVEGSKAEFQVGKTGPISNAASKMNAFSVKGFCYGCSQTDNLWVLEGDSNGKYGLRFNLLKVEPFDAFKEGQEQQAFSSQMDDCAPLFSVGSWMGLIVGLFIVAVLVFALSMINALQVMDRFDDPRGKPLQINVKGE